MNRPLARYPDAFIWTGAIIVMVAFWPVTLWRFAKAILAE